MWNACTIFQTRLQIHKIGELVDIQNRNVCWDASLYEDRPLLIWRLNMGTAFLCAFHPLFLCFFLSFSVYIFLIRMNVQTFRSLVLQAGQQGLRRKKEPLSRKDRNTNENRISWRRMKTRPRVKKQKSNPKWSKNDTGGLERMNHRQSQISVVQTAG